MTQVTLNHKQYFVNNDDFPIYDHPEYITLSLRPQLGVLEREVGLINELIEVYDSEFINIGIKHGGYVPIEVKASNKSVIIRNLNIEDLNNFDKNMSEHKETVKLIDEIPELYENKVYLFRFDYNNVKLIDDIQIFYI